MQPSDIIVLSETVIDLSKVRHVNLFSDELVVHFDAEHFVTVRGDDAAALAARLGAAIPPPGKERRKFDRF